MCVFYDGPSSRQQIVEDLIATRCERLMEWIIGLLTGNAESHIVDNCPQRRRLAGQRQF